MEKETNAPKGGMTCLKSLSKWEAKQDHSLHTTETVSASMPPHVVEGGANWPQTTINMATPPLKEEEGVGSICMTNSPVAQWTKLYELSQHP